MKQLMIRDLPASERPYERCFQMGASALSDRELLAVILRTGTIGASAIDLAGSILRHCPPHTGVSGLLHMSADELQEVDGIGQVKAAQILCIAELSRRIARSGMRERVTFHTADEIADYYMEFLRHREQESVYCMMLDARNHLCSEAEITRGTVNASLIRPREVFLTALQHRAVQIVLIHNHPSGSEEPSGDDMQATRDLVRAGDLIGIPLLDHIIIGDGRYTSLRRTEPWIFGENTG